MKTFPKKSVWHSDLRAASPLVLRFVGGVTESRFKDRERYAGGIYVDFQVAGDPTTYNYNIENEVIEHQIGVVGAMAENEAGWIKMTATGNREEAELICEEPAPQEIPAEPVEPYRSVERAAEHALVLSGRLHKRFEREFGHPPTETEISFAISMMIRSENTGLPVTEIEAQLRAGGESQPEQPEQEPTVEGAGESLATPDQLLELRELADSRQMSEEKYEEFERWVGSGDVTQIDYVKARNRLLAMEEVTP